MLVEDERDQLCEQLINVTAQRDLLIAMCPAEKENSRLREQVGKATVQLQALGAKLAQCTAALERIASDHQNYEANGPGQYGIGVTDGHRCSANIARAALADLPDA